MPSTPGQTETETATSLEAGAAPSRPLGLTVLSSPDASLTGRFITVESELSIGRQATGQGALVVDDRRMSRQHAVIVRRGASFELRDNDSRNGCSVEGQKITTCALPAGAVFRVGDTLFELGPEAPPGVDTPPLIGRSTAFVQALGHLDAAAPSAVTVLLLGETGTGKELAARYLHDASGQKGAFVAVNCGAIPPDLVEAYLFGHVKGAFSGASADARGVFAQAHGGTLFLDEVGELPLLQQPKLLRALETCEVTPIGGAKLEKVEVRVVAATNANLLAEAAAGTFRQDLYARLSGYVVELPPLRQRRLDIPALARHFLAQLAPERRFELTSGFIEQLLVYRWPRNIRELRNAMQRLALRPGENDVLSAEDLQAVLDRPPAKPAPAGVVAASPAPRADRFVRPSKDELVAELARLNGNVTKLAEHYAKDPKQIYRWLKRYGLSVERR